MDENNRNLVLAAVLSMMVLLTWQIFIVRPEAERNRQLELARQQAAQQQMQNQPSQQAGTQQPGGIGQQPAAPIGMPGSKTREQALADSQRVAIDTPSLQGSIALKGARIDDLVLTQFNVTVKPGSEKVTLLSPSSGPSPYYAEFGWISSQNDPVQLPNSETIWKLDNQGPLTPSNALKLSYDNGSGLIFRRTIAIDENYMFTATEEVENAGTEPVTLTPWSLISRHGKPKIEGFFIMHEGPLGVLGEEGLEEVSYDDLAEQKTISFDKVVGGWLGMTDKYWAAAIIPDQRAEYKAHFSAFANPERYQTDYLLQPITIAPKSKGQVSSMLFAGAKQVGIVDAYEAKYNITLFNKLIDWGWFPYITKPLFYALDFFYHLVGNFGIAILIVTVLVKLIFFPLANKSYESMSKMKKLQPEMTRLRDRYKDDRMKQQQELMALYKKEKINPMAGCLPILIQIPVFFALYKVLYVSIEMRHAPFFGWIQDLSAPDPTTIFNLFGLIPWSPPEFLMIGIWPLFMGVTMFLQMKMNPAPPDPIQQKIFTWMPILFTFMLATFPAGLVIYWTWNNSLSILQQWVIMRRQGVDVNLLENIGIRKSASSTSKG